MKPQGLAYAVSLRVCNADYLLLWQDGGDMPDKYCVQPGAMQFLLARTSTELLRKATKFELKIADQEPVVMDLDKAFRVLAALRPNKTSSERSCQILLDAWNTLEDMARSLNISLEGKIEDMELLHVAYDKLFYGNNLSPVTPVNENYNPLFSSEERRVMRSYFRQMWCEILERTGQFSSEH